MDVRLYRIGFLSFLSIFALLFSSCGNRYDTNTESGRDAIINNANLHLSHSECQLAYNDISKLYGTGNQTEEVQLIMASTWACFAGFNMLSMAANIVGATNFFSVLAKSMPSGKVSYIYKAVDVLTSANTAIKASARSTSLNNYMVFIQMAVIGSILSTYGSPSSTGAQGTTISYSVPRVNGDLSTLDACALAAAFSILVDSFQYSSFTDSSTTALKTSMNSACVSAGYTSCTVINQYRTLCTGIAGDTPSTVASALVGAVDSAW